MRVTGGQQATPLTWTFLNPTPVIWSQNQLPKLRLSLRFTPPDLQETQVSDVRTPRCDCPEPVRATDVPLDGRSGRCGQRRTIGTEADTSGRGDWIPMSHPIISI